MATRYATIITGDDGQEIVSNISLLEGHPEQPANGRIVAVPDSVKIGDAYQEEAKAAKGKAAKTKKGSDETKAPAE